MEESRNFYYQISVLILDCKASALVLTCPVVVSQETEGEEGEEAEQQRWTKRTQQMMHVLDRVYSHGGDKASFRTLVARCNRKQVAARFYTLLVLKKLQGIMVEQVEPFGDISITKGPKYGTVS